ncbi:MAG: GNAT family N-acetyltransferase [Mitsuaria chitosanitabida]|uniref:GNAT family N-acetyltransferase n=1 Tax=Roseateles chitosanitabidus TaxID=65048 RepID=UPI001B0A8431|nr:GNAT family N-acetyltransferase [Roseateles chitosanitabidus]MBO9688619.1 GNAT family N-acetyltransferase [Roseateles chitosanitabidus]
MSPFPPLTAPSLVLEPVCVAHAEEMHAVLADPSIYAFLSDEPPTLDGLRAAYERRSVGHSPDGAEQWFNWMLRRDDGRLIGYVQATIESRDRCWIGYVMSREGRGHGHATRAVAAMIAYLQREHDAWRLLASVDARNARSIALLDRLGFDLAPPHAKELAELGAGDRLYLLELVSA